MCVPRVEPLVKNAMVANEPRINYFSTAKACTVHHQQCSKITSTCQDVWENGSHGFAVAQLGLVLIITENEKSIKNFNRGENVNALIVERDR